MPFNVKNMFFSMALLIIILSAPVSAFAEGTTLNQTIEHALNWHPQLKALSDNRQALKHDLSRSQGGYLPTLDLLLGYGVEQYSDEVTRQSNADPSDSDWDSRSDASLRLTQKIYDGGETGSQVSIRQASLDAAGYQFQSAALTVAMDAITAHLNVFRQRELVSLAEKNIEVHRDIYQSLANREQVGAGSISDVTLARSRLANAEVTLYRNQADQNRAVANYARVVGIAPGELVYAKVPEVLPRTLEEIQQQVEQMNPTLLAADAEIDEADSRLALAQTNYKPKIDLELSSSYNDQREGEPSWQNANAAMLNLRWNLYNGGQDREGVKAALSRKSQSRSQRTDKLVTLKEEASSIWASYLSLQQQKEAYLDAVNYSRRTFDAYLVQFSVSRRSLMDVLIAGNEYFQSAGQLINVDINETIAAYQLLSLTGKIYAPRVQSNAPEYYQRLTQPLDTPFVTFPDPISVPASGM